MTLKLSIITVNLNNAKGLERTIESVISQSFKDFEYILIDGGSEDESCLLINSYIKHLKFYISEKDNGIYHAQNKGILNSNGIYCLFLNSGDYLVANEILEKVFSEAHNEDIFYGDILVNKNGSLQKGSAVPEHITLEYITGNVLMHPATFIKRELFNKYGLYNENYRIISDWEFILKAVLFHNISTYYIPFPVSVFDTNGISSKNENKDILRKEVESVRRTLIPEIILEHVENYKTLELKYKKIESQIPRKRIKAFLTTLIRKFKKV